MKVEARAPTRVDLAGGTVDIWPLYLFHPGAQTVNLALRRHATCEISTRADRRAGLVSGVVRRRQRRAPGLRRREARKAAPPVFRPREALRPLLHRPAAQFRH